MANARRRRGVAARRETETTAALPTTRSVASPRERAPDPKRASPGRPRWGLGLGAVALVVAALGAAPALPWFGENGGVGAAQPIARLDAADVHSLLVDPTEPNRVVFGSHAGIQESRDGGYSWEDSGLKNVDAMGFGASPGEPATVYAAGHDLFVVSRDRGETWHPVPHNLPGTDLHAFAQDPADPRRLYTLVAGSRHAAARDRDAHGAMTTVFERRGVRAPATR